MTARSVVARLFGSYLTTEWRGLNDPNAECHQHLDALCNFATGPIWQDDLLRHIDAAKLAAEAVCEVHDAERHDALLYAWRVALEGFYRLPRAELRPDDREVYAAFEKLAVKFNSRVWLDT